MADNAAGATPKNLTADYDFDIGGGLAGDQRAPRGGAPGNVIWSKDDRSLYGAVAEHGRANLKRIDAATGKVGFTIDHKASMMSCEVSPDGRTLLTAGGKHHLRLWDAKTGGAGPVMEDPDEELIYKAMFTPDGKSVLTMNGEATVRLWDIATSKVRATWTGASTRTSR